MKVIIDNQVDISIHEFYAVALLLHPAYRDFLCEDFHFGYKVLVDPETGEQYVQVFDAVHSLLFHN